jgi:general secretion pathway protein E
VPTTTGCDQCRQSGYQGRSGIFELLIVDEPLRHLIHDSAGDDRLREHARAQGMISLREDGLRWVRTGETSLAEVLRSSRE